MVAHPAERLVEHRGDGLGTGLARLVDRGQDAMPQWMRDCLHQSLLRFVGARGHEADSSGAVCRLDRQRKREI
jgi:hypothetical protein